MEPGLREPGRRSPPTARAPDQDADCDDGFLLTTSAVLIELTKDEARLLDSDDDRGVLCDTVVPLGPNIVQSQTIEPYKPSEWICVHPRPGNRWLSI